MGAFTGTNNLKLSIEDLRLKDLEVSFFGFRTTVGQAARSGWDISVAHNPSMAAVTFLFTLRSEGLRLWTTLSLDIFRDLRPYREVLNLNCSYTGVVNESVVERYLDPDGIKSLPLEVVDRATLADFVQSEPKKGVSELLDEILSVQEKNKSKVRVSKQVFESVPLRKVVG